MFFPFLGPWAEVVKFIEETFYLGIFGDLGGEVRGGGEGKGWGDHGKGTEILTYHRGCCFLSVFHSQFG